jgi:hypothetical protein
MAVILVAFAFVLFFIASFFAAVEPYRIKLIAGGLAFLTLYMIFTSQAVGHLVH